MSESDDQHDEDVLGVVGLLAKVFEHALKMEGRHGIAVTAEAIEATVNRF